MASVSPSAAPTVHEWTQKRARSFIRVPGASDDKYSHGVLGVVTGSSRYPGAAVLSVEAAHRTGIGMVRYLGDATVAERVLTRRPETVTVPGRVQAWLVGSGIDVAHRTHAEFVAIQAALTSALPVVIDAGALDLVPQSQGPTVIVPHARELATVLVPEGTSQAYTTVVSEIQKNPAGWAQRAADQLGVVAVLKGHRTYIATPQPQLPAPRLLSVPVETSWLATAGTGDVLAGIIGALVATHAASGAAVGITLPELAELAATGVLLHAQAAKLASAGAPITALDVAEAVPWVIRSWGEA